MPCKLYDASVAVSAAGDTVYVTAGDAPDDNSLNNVYCYNAHTNHWTVLPQPGHQFGILHMLDDRLTIFGGQDRVAMKVLNKVTTYNIDTNRWCSCYPDMLNKRFRPGVITYHNNVIVMGGMSSPDTFQDTIEVMNYQDELQWREISVHLPRPMTAIKPIISGESVVIIGYITTGGCSTGHYQIRVEEMISLEKPLSNGAESTQWEELSPATHWNTATVPYSSPPVIIGGRRHSNQGAAPTCDIKLYDASKNLWRKVNSLTSVRQYVGVALLNNNTIVVIGGSRGGVDVEANMESSVTTVDIGNIVVKN